MRILARASVLLTLSSAAAVTLASPPAAAQAVDDKARAEARERFDRGLRLFNQGDNSGALAEFQKAYELTAHPVVFFNIALVHAAQRDPVRAVEALDRLLADPGELDAGRLEKAKAERKDQAARIGFLDVTANVEGARIEVDNLDTVKTPVTKPLPVASGEHLVAVIAKGHVPKRRRVTVAGLATAKVSMVLEAVEGALAQVKVEANVPDAEVVIDGTVVGTTPLPTSLAVAPGKHRLEVRRSGYVAFGKDLSLGGSTGEVVAKLEVDPAAVAREGGMLALDISEPDSVVFVDGTPRSPYASPIAMPAGAHVIKIERADFFPFERNVTVDKGGSTSVPVDLQPTPEYRADYRSTATAMRTLGWVGVGAGAAIAAGGGAWLFINQGRKEEKKKAFDAEAARWDQGGDCDPRTQQASNRRRSISRRGRLRGSDSRRRGHRHRRHSALRGRRPRSLRAQGRQRRLWQPPCDARRLDRPRWRRRGPRRQLLMSDGPSRARWPHPTAVARDSRGATDSPASHVGA